MPKKASKQQGSSQDFETAVKNLEQIISKMESDQLSLEDSLKSFEEGIKLTGHCQELLSKAQQKVDILMQEQEDKFQEFELEEDDDVEYLDDDE